VIAFVVPAHNEELLIARTLESIHQSARALGQRYEIIVADDACTDRTAEIARAYQAQVVSIARRQIAAARNAGARAALQNDEVRMLFFVDADTSVNDRTLRAALEAIDQRAVGGGATVRFDGPVPHWAEVMLRIILAMFRLFKWSGGCFIFCRRDAFEATGGWDESLYAGEELFMAQALKRHGRFVVLREPIVTSGRKLRSHSAREILTSLFRIGLSGRRAVRSRKALALWYGPRETLKSR
jgi:glycosyltransferase involved in cell wall biosynthesis